MDNLTHGLTGALMAQTGLKKKTGLGMAALIFGANLPDLDVVGLLWLDSTEALGFRRGITHGPFGIMLLPIGLAALLYWFDQWQAKRGKRPEHRRPVSFKWLYILGVIGAISHSLMDWLNVYGVRFLYPLDKSWYYGDTLFIIDVWLWAFLALAVWYSLRREKREQNWQKPAQAAVVAVLVYIGANWGITQNAEGPNGMMAEPYPDFVIGSPPPAYSWQRERIIQVRDGRWFSNSWQGEEITNGYRSPEGLQCEVPANAAEQSSQALGFMTWSRAPMALRAEDGSVTLFDARFYDPRARFRFSVDLPDVECVELPAP
jgi:inner membrane protein